MTPNERIAQDMGYQQQSLSLWLAFWLLQQKNLETLIEKVRATDWDYSKLTTPEECQPMLQQVQALEQEWRGIAQGLPWQFMSAGGQESVSPGFQRLIVTLQSEQPQFLIRQREQQAAREAAAAEAQRIQAEADAAQVRELERLGFQRRGE